MNPRNKRKAKILAHSANNFTTVCKTHLRRLHGFETFGEVDGTLLQLVRDPGELVAMDDGGLAGGVVGGPQSVAA